MEKQNIWFVAIVAVVAVVGIVLMVSSGGTKAGSCDLAGEAYKVSKISCVGGDDNYCKTVLNDETAICYVTRSITVKAKSSGYCSLPLGEAAITPAPIVLESVGGGSSATSCNTLKNSCGFVTLEKLGLCEVVLLTENPGLKNCIDICAQQPGNQKICTDAYMDAPFQIPGTTYIIHQWYPVSCGVGGVSNPMACTCC